MTRVSLFDSLEVYQRSITVCSGLYCTGGNEEHVQSAKRDTRARSAKHLSTDSRCTTIYTLQKLSHNIQGALDLYFVSRFGFSYLEMLQAAIISLHECPAPSRAKSLYVCVFLFRSTHKLLWNSYARIEKCQHKRKGKEVTLEINMMSKGLATVLTALKGSCFTIFEL